MYCRYCGNDLEDDKPKFCPYCGSNLQDEYIENQEEIKDDIIENKRIEKVEDEKENNDKLIKQGRIFTIIGLVIPWIVLITYIMICVSINIFDLGTWVDATMIFFLCVPFGILMVVYGAKENRKNIPGSILKIVLGIIIAAINFNIGRGSFQDANYFYHYDYDLGSDMIDEAKLPLVKDKVYTNVFEIDREFIYILMEFDDNENMNNIKSYLDSNENIKKDSLDLNFGSLKYFDYSGVYNLNTHSFGSGTDTDTYYLFLYDSTHGRLVIINLFNSYLNIDMDNIGETINI